MRRRLVVSTIAIVLVVLAAAAAPVAVLLRDAGVQQLEFQLDRQLDEAVALYNREFTATGRPSFVLVATAIGPDDGIVISQDGVTLYEVESPETESVRSASRLTVDGTRISMTTSADLLDETFRRQIVVLLLLALGAVAAAGGLALVQARQLARPLEQLAGRARRLFDGDFSSPPYEAASIEEIDRIGRTLDASAQKVSAMLAAERHFTADATHQLRTGIAGIAMRLEILSLHPEAAVSGEATTALEQTDQLNATIDDLLAATRARSTEERSVFDLTELVASHVDEWRRRFVAAERELDLSVVRAAPPVVATKGLVGQVLDILIHNSLRHGAGRTEVVIHGPSVTVSDQGAGVPPERVATLFDGPVDPSARHGRGLGLARRLAQVDGARLDLVSNPPARFRYGLVQASGGSR